MTTVNYFEGTIDTDVFKCADVPTNLDLENLTVFMLKELRRQIVFERVFRVPVLRYIFDQLGGESDLLDSLVQQLDLSVECYNKILQSVHPSLGASFGGSNGIESNTGTSFSAANLIKPFQNEGVIGHKTSSPVGVDDCTSDSTGEEIPQPHAGEGGAV